MTLSPSDRDNMRERAKRISKKPRVLMDAHDLARDVLVLLDALEAANKETATAWDYERKMLKRATTAEQALAAAEAERDDEIRAADHLAKEFSLKERALTDYFADASRRAEAAEAEVTRLEPIFAAAESVIHVIDDDGFTHTSSEDAFDVLHELEKVVRPEIDRRTSAHTQGKP